MSNMIEKLSDETLNQVAGGMTVEMKVAYDVIDGKYGNGAARRTALEKAGYSYETIQNLVNHMLLK